MFPECNYDHDYKTLYSCSSCGYKQKEENMSDNNIVTEFDVADAEEAMNQAILEYSNMCYLLGKQRGEEKAPEKKAYTVTAHFDGTMELVIYAASAEEAKDMAKHPVFRDAWVIDEDSTRINAIFKAEETE